MGGAYIGLKVLEREAKLYMDDKDTQPELEGYEYVIERQLKPEPRRDIVRELKKRGIVPNAMIDISDGLSSELLHICKESGVGCRVYEDKIPIHEQTEFVSNKFRLDPSLAAMNGGEDYELLFTVPLDKKEIIEEMNDVAIIGYICEDANCRKFVARNGVELDLKAQGWNAF